MAFFLLSGRNSARPLDLWAATREGDAPLELVYGMSRVSGCGTLLLYSRPACSNYVLDQWS
jgi:hypothetical protein